MQADSKLRFVCISISVGDCISKSSVIDCQAYDITKGTIFTARDMLIKRARAEYIAESKPIPGEDEPASQMIYKFPFRDKLVGYYHFDNGLAFLFSGNSPMYELIAAGHTLDDGFAERLYDLYQFYNEKHRD